MKKLDLSPLQTANVDSINKLLSTPSNKPEVCRWEVDSRQNGRLIQRKPVASMPVDLEGKRRYLAQLMPRLQTPSLARALEVLKSDDTHVLSYCEPYQATQRPARPRAGTCQASLNLCTEPKWRGELASLAAGEAMSLAESDTDPLDDMSRYPLTQELAALIAWLRLEAKFEQRLCAQVPFDELDQTDPFEEDHITKVIGEDGEPILLRKLPAQSNFVSTFSRRQMRHGFLVEMLREVALIEPLHSRVLAKAWGIPFAMAGLGLEAAPDQHKIECRMVAHILCWSNMACDNVLRRHIRRCR